MRLALTLVHTHGSEDIVVTADASATVGMLAAEIAQRAAPESDGSTAVTLEAVHPGQEHAVVLPQDARLGESWLGSGATVRVIPAGRFVEAAMAGPSVVTLTVTAPNGQSRRLPLARGSYLLGRAPSCDVPLEDPLVSQRHARLDVGETVTVVDLGSANGIETEGGLVSRLHVSTTAELWLGDTALTLAVDAAGPTSSAAGPVAHNRSPRVEPRYLGRTFTIPEVPQEREPQPFPLLAMMTPVLLGSAMFLITKNPLSLLFIAMTPLMLLGNTITSRRREKKRQARAIAVFEERLAGLDAILATEHERETVVRRGEAPTTAEVIVAAREREELLWTRRPEHWSFGQVRLGRGTMASRNTVELPEGSLFLPEFLSRAEDLVERTRTVADVPLIDNLHDAGALGVSGTPIAVAGVLNSILIQLTALHSPAELVVAALAAPHRTDALDWLRWIPHTSSPQSPLPVRHLVDAAASAANLVSALEELVSERLAEVRPEDRGALSRQRAALERGGEVGESSSAEPAHAPLPIVVVVIADDGLVDRSRLVQLSERAADAGVYPIWVSDTRAALPAVCRSFVDVAEDGAHGVVGLVRLGESITDAVVESVDAAAARDYARRLAPVLDAGAAIEDASDLPRSVSMVTLLGPELFEQAPAVVDRWQQNFSLHARGRVAAPGARRAGRLRAIVGSAGADALHLDLRAQGPHALVGGTTGSGKSEFLQAWVLGMAAEYSPDRVTFLFVDYKGGSAFAECVALPHCVGLVTDLSPHLVRRALTSLRAELHHREHLLNRKKAKDLIELEKRGDPDSPPALVLVIDEFAALASEVPEFVDGVVDIAQRGRSLGIHLIMATQRPAGVIKDNLRANTNMRIALRMADESDSNDVVGTVEAAHFDPTLPGRALAKTGPGRLHPFQSAYAGGWTSAEPERPNLAIASESFGALTPWVREESVVSEDRDLGPTDQQRLVRTIVRASAEAGVPEPRRPWLDELAPVYDVSRLRQRSDAQLLLGVSDLPESQQQRPVYFAPDTDGHLAIYGTGGSGKSTLLRTLATAAGITPRGGPVHVYALDFGAGSLRMIEDLPHVGSVISGDDSERTIRLLRMLRQEMEARAPRFAEARASSITEYRSLTGRPEEPRILLLIDGFASFRQEYEIPAGRSAWYGVFQDIISDGRQLGIHVAFTADRTGSVPSAIAASVQRRVVLRLADDTAYAMLDVPTDILSANSVPGRAIVDGEETQIAVLGGSAELAQQSQATRELAEAMQRAGRGNAPEIRSLPTEYSAAELPARARGVLALGIGDEDLEAVGFEPQGTFLIAGPPSSGRSMAVRGVVDALRRFDPEMRLYYIGNSRSVLSRSTVFEDRATSIEEAAALASLLHAAITDPETEGRIALVVEQIGDFLQTPADNPIVDVIRAVKRSDHLIVAEAESSVWNSSWPLLGEFKNGRRGLLLQPETIDGDIVLKTALGRMARAEFPPGRGVLVGAGKYSRIQLPLVAEDTAH